MSARKTGLFALVAVAAITSSVSAQDGRPEQRVGEFFDALVRERWVEAAALIHPAQLDAFKDQQVSMLIALTRRHEELRKSKIAPRRGHEYEISYSAVLSPDVLAQYSDAPIGGMGKARTIGAAHGLLATEFMAHWLAARSQDPDSGYRKRFARVPRTIVGGVIEADSVAHVLYRVPKEYSHRGNPSDVEIMRLRQYEGRWYLWPNSNNVDFRIGASPFLRLQLPLDALGNSGRD